MLPQIVGRQRDGDEEELTSLASPDVPWPHELPAHKLASSLVRSAFEYLALEAQAEQRRARDLGDHPGDTQAKRNRREVYLDSAQRRRWESRAHQFLERRQDVVRALSVETLYSVVLTQHLLDLDAADPDLPAGEHCSDDTFEDGINSQFLLDVPRGRYIVDGEVLHFAEAEPDESEDAFVSRATNAVREVVRSCPRMLERVTTAMSQSGIAAVERASLCHTVVSGGTVEVEYRLDHDPEREGGFLVRLQTCRRGFREYLPSSSSTEDVSPSSCETSSFVLKTATVAYGPSGEVDVTDFREDVRIRRNGETLDPALFCDAIAWLPADGATLQGTPAPARRCSLLGLVRTICVCVRGEQREQEPVSATLEL